MTAQHSSSIDVPGLGRLTALENSPPGEQFWAGAYRYDDDGQPAQSSFYLCVRSAHEPSEQQREFAARAVASISDRIREARQLLKRKLSAEPEFFGVDAEEAARVLGKGDALLPFGAPEPTFYDPEDWQIRFAESSLPACDPQGVTVTFTGMVARDVEDLSDAEEID